MIRTRAGLLLVALVIMATLILCGIITPDEGIAGFSNRATVTIAALFRHLSHRYKHRQ